MGHVELNNVFAENFCGQFTPLYFQIGKPQLTCQPSVFGTLKHGIAGI
jgi:hypothetical protein